MQWSDPIRRMAFDVKDTSAVCPDSDHRNLLFITDASNPMIVRWYMALSEFSFSLEFIPGVDNDIAAAEAICFGFQRKTAEYTESDFRVNMFIADTSFPLARHVVGPQNTRWAPVCFKTVGRVASGPF